MNLNPSPKQKIVDLIYRFIQKERDWPTKIYIPRYMECSLMMLSSQEAGELVSTIVVKGVRFAFPTIFGMEVIWDARDLAVSND